MVRTRDTFPGEDFDELLEVDPDETDTTYTVTVNSAGRVSQESWADTATAFELKRIEYTYNSNDYVATEVRKVFDPDDGTTILSQKTITYSYATTDGRVTGAASVRNV